MPKKARNKKPPGKPQNKINPLDQMFEEWYTNFGVRFYTPEGHKEYLRYAYVHGIVAGTNIVQDQLSPKG
jgi:hypothetical protein